jgi:hypothetical protein
MEEFKIKRISGILLLSFLLVGGSSFAFANTGEKLYSWYSGKFSENSKQFANPSDQISLLSELHNDLNALKARSKEEINQLTIGVTLESKETIALRNRDYIGQLQKTTVALSKQNIKDMEQFKETKTLEETQQMTADTEEILSSILGEN